IILLLHTRFSSGDLSGELEDEDATQRKQEVITTQAKSRSRQASVSESPGDKKLSKLRSEADRPQFLNPRQQKSRGPQRIINPKRYLCGTKSQPDTSSRSVSSNKSSGLGTSVGGSASVSPSSSTGVPSSPPAPSPAPAAAPAATESRTSGFSLNFTRPGSKTTSAPTSPSKSRESFLQRVSSLTGAVRGEVVNQVRPAYNKDRCFTLLVIDDQNTDWSKYFRGKRIHGDWDIRVEQAEFREISVTASSDGGCNVAMVVFRNAAKVVRSFKPDFVLIRQNLCDANENHKNTLLALKFGGVPSINSVNAIYNFQDKPWVFAHMLEIQKRLGKENFPLIEQHYFPNHKEMLSATRYPCVFKIGHAHGGLGKVKVNSNADFQDMASVVAVSNAYCTTEPFIDAKFDIHIQKIGGSYKCFQRKSISGNWKTNMGSAMLEQAPMTERYKNWVDEVAKLFGGLDICAIEAIVDKSGNEHIIEVNDSALSLMGDSQEDDRRYIAELVATKLQSVTRPAPSDLTRGGSRQSLSGMSTGTAQSSRGGSPVEDTSSRINIVDNPLANSGSPGQQRRDSQEGEKEKEKEVKHKTSCRRKGEEVKHKTKEKEVKHKTKVKQRYSDATEGGEPSLQRSEGGE
ncbi:unnamed protein product, partial [Meganyctiphanes norvegica]